MRQEMTESDRETLADLLVRSGQADKGAQNALCKRLGIYEHGLLFLDTPPPNFAVELIYYLNQTGNFEALSYLCRLMSPVFRGQLKEDLERIQSRLPVLSQDQSQVLGTPSISQDGENHPLLPIEEVSERKIPPDITLEPTIITTPADIVHTFLFQDPQLNNLEKELHMHRSYWDELEVEAPLQDELAVATFFNLQVRHIQNLSSNIENIERRVVRLGDVPPNIFQEVLLLLDKVKANALGIQRAMQIIPNHSFYIVINNAAILTVENTEQALEGIVDKIRINYLGIRLHKLSIALKQLGEILQRMQEMVEGDLEKRRAEGISIPVYRKYGSGYYSTN